MAIKKPSPGLEEGRKSPSYHVNSFLLPYQPLGAELKAEIFKQKGVRCVKSGNIRSGCIKLNYIGTEQ
jgi:hypothetical protein